MYLFYYLWSDVQIHVTCFFWGNLAQMASAAAGGNPATSIAAMIGLPSDKPVLPPLPTTTNNMTIASAAEEIQESEQILQSHYLTLQDKLLSSMDRQVATIQERLNENDLVLARTEDEKNAIGVNLYKANIQVGRLNEQVYVAHNNESRLSQKCLALESERDGMKLELKAMSDMNMNLISQLNMTKQRLEESTDKATKLTDINLTYNSDIKIHRRIESKIKKELQYVDQRRRVAETDLEDQKKITEKLVQQRNEMELIMEAQKQETGIANQTIAKMHSEISSLKASKKRMEKQWEESMTAMTKRDITFQSVEQQKEEIKEDLNETALINNALKNELEETSKRFTMKELVTTIFYLYFRVQRIGRQNTILAIKLANVGSETAGDSRFAC
ncbi:hypothetical protein BDR26DRAFT_353931 [Obelidium mucronatum]|nr:hypothetical protein BDR26DRAFT_353931 [Obelidium mucronatum]